MLRFSLHELRAVAAQARARSGRPQPSTQYGEGVKRIVPRVERQLERQLRRQQVLYSLWCQSRLVLLTSALSGMLREAADRNRAGGEAWAGSSMSGEAA